MRSANALALLPLAIGVVNEAARVPGPHRIPPGTSQTAAACNVKSLADCPVTGCAPPGSGHAALNQRKRTIPGGGSPTVLTFADFKQLQTEAGVLFPPKRELEIPAADRAKLSDLKYSTGTVSEGDLVQAIGFIVADPRPEAGESVNCGLTGKENNDFHIPLGPDVGPDMDFQGIVVEMIPQDRNPNCCSTTAFTFRIRIPAMSSAVSRIACRCGRCTRLPSSWSAPWKMDRLRPAATHPGPLIGSLSKTIPRRHPGMPRSRARADSCCEIPYHQRPAAADMICCTRALRISVCGHYNRLLLCRAHGLELVEQFRQYRKFSDRSAASPSFGGEWDEGRRLRVCRHRRRLVAGRT